MLNGGVPSATTTNSITIPFALPPGGSGNLIITNIGTNPINVSADQNNSQNNSSATGTISVIPPTLLNSGVTASSSVPANMSNGNVLHVTSSTNGGNSGISIGFQPLIGNSVSRVPRFKTGYPIIGNPNFSRDRTALRNYFGALLNY